MTALRLWQYPFVLAATLALSLVLTPLALRVALGRSMLDHPTGHKAQALPVPYLGGAAIVGSFALVVVGGAIVRPPVAGLGELAILMAIGVGLALVGLADDVWGLDIKLRLVLEIGAGVGVWAAGTTAELFTNGPADAVATVAWVVVITNAFNLLDNIDGLSAGVAAIASMAFFTVAYVNGQFLVAVLSVALAGCAAGFLRHNFHPARIYMGDAGSLFLGFMLSVLALRLRAHGPTRANFFVPVLVLGVALFDTALVVVTRIIHHRSPLAGGRDHTSHRLVLLGIPVPAAVSLIYGAAVALGWLGVVMARVDRVTSFVLMGLVASVAAFLGVLLGMVPVYETSRRRHYMIAEVVPHEKAAK